MAWNTKIRASTSRAYVMSSDELLPTNDDGAVSESTKQLIKEKGHKTYRPGIDDVLLAPDTYNEINEQWREKFGRDLAIGDVVMLHRDPALPDASSQALYVFKGIAQLEQPFGSHNRGIVVHPQAESWKVAAGDFDGDSGVLTIVDENTYPAEQRKPPATGPEIGYLKKKQPGSAVDPSKEPFKKEFDRIFNETKAAFDARNAKLGRNVFRIDKKVRAGGNRNNIYDLEIHITTAQPNQNGDLVPETQIYDALSMVAMMRASSYSQMIGQIISLAQKLGEVNALDNLVDVPIFDQTTGQYRLKPGEQNKVETTQMSAAAIISKLGQGSVSAKKKAAWADQATDMFNRLSKYVLRQKPIKRDPATGHIIYEIAAPEYNNGLEYIANNPAIIWERNRPSIIIRTANGNERVPLKPKKTQYITKRFKDLQRAPTRNSFNYDRRVSANRAAGIPDFAIDPTVPDGYVGEPVSKEEVWQVIALEAQRIVDGNNSAIRRIIASPLVARVRTEALDKAWVELRTNLESIIQNSDNPTAVRAAREVLPPDGTTRYAVALKLNALADNLPINQRVYDLFKKGLQEVQDVVPTSERWVFANPVYNELAKRVLAQDRIFSELDLFNHKVFSDLTIESAREIASETMDENKDIVFKGWNTELKMIRDAMSRLGARAEDEAEHKALSERRAEINNEIKTAYLVRYITGAELVAYGPPRTAARLLSEYGINELQEIAANVKVDDNNTFTVKARGADGKFINGTSVPSGVYELLIDKKNISLKLLTPYQRGKATDVTIDLTAIKNPDLIQYVSNIAGQEGAYNQVVVGVTGTRLVGNAFKVNVGSVGNAEFVQSVKDRADVTLMEFSNQENKAISSLKDRESVKNNILRQLQKIAGSDPNLFGIARNTPYADLSKYIVRLHNNFKDTQQGEDKGGYAPYLKDGGKTLPEILAEGKNPYLFSLKLDDKNYYFVLHSLGPNSSNPRLRRLNGILLGTNPEDASASYAALKNIVSRKQAYKSTRSTSPSQQAYAPEESYVNVPYDISEVNEDDMQRAMDEYFNQNPDIGAANESKSLAPEHTPQFDAENANVLQLQRLVDDLDIVFDQKTNVTVLGRLDMLSKLDAMGTEAAQKAARSIRQQQKGKAGISGYHLVDNLGNHFIFVSSMMPPEAQAAILTHEYGHRLIETEWNKLYLENEEVANRIWTDFQKWAAAGNNLKGLDAALRKRIATTTLAELIDPTQSTAPKTMPGIDRVFKEWLADQIGASITTNKKMQELGGRNWFSDMAQKFLNAFKELKAYVMRTFGGADTIAPLASVNAWMNHLSQGRASRLARVYPQHQGEMLSLKERIQRRNALIKKWINLGGIPDVDALNEIIPDIAQNLDVYLAPQDAALIRRVASEPNMRRRMMTLLGKNTQAAEAIMKNQDLAAAYMFMMAETGVLRPSGEAGLASQKMKEAVTLKNRLAIETTQEEIDAILERLNQDVPNRHQTPLFDNDSPFARLYAERSKRYNEGLFGALQKGANGYTAATDWLISSGLDRVLRTNIPTLRFIAEAISPAAFELAGLKRSGSFDKQLAVYQVFAEQFVAAIQGLSAHENSQLRDILLQMPGAEQSASQKAVKAANEIKKVFQYVYKYETWRNEGGSVDMGEREGYFPMVLNTDYVRQNLDKTVADFTSHPLFEGGWYRVQDEYIKWIDKAKKKARTPEERQALEDEQVRIRGMEQRAFVREYLSKAQTHELPNWQLRKLAPGKIHTPGFRYANPRILDFLLKSGDPVTHRKVINALEPDVTQTIEKRIRSGVRRAEHEYMMKELGDFDALIERARNEEGATDADIDLLIDYIDAVQGMLGIKERDWLDAKIDGLGPNSVFKPLHSGQTGVMNKKLEAANAWIATANIWGSLGLSAFASMIDPLGAAMRSSSNKAYMSAVKLVFDDMVNTFKNLPISEKAKIVQLIGAAENSMNRDDLINTHSAGVSTPTTHKLNSILFKLNGTEFITAFSRKLAGITAQFSILEWLERTQKDPNDQAAWQELHNLGLMPEDIKLTDDGKEIKILTRQEYWDLLEVVGVPNDRLQTPEQRMEKALAAAELERDLRVRTAIFRFNDESSVRPGPTSRQLLASNPYFLLPMQWKSFATTWNDRIWRPMIERAVQDRNYRPMMIAFGPVLAVMIFSDLVRDAIVTAARDDDEEEKDWFLRNRPNWKRDWDTADHIAYGLERMGAYGQHENVIDLVSPLFKGEPDKAVAELGSVTGSNLLKYIKYDQLPMPLGNIIKPISRDMKAAEKKNNTYQDELYEMPLGGVA